MSNILIEVLDDWNECEQCGGGTEYGGRVLIDNNLVFEHIPNASCYGNEDVSKEDLINIALKHLGHTLEISYTSTTDEDI